MPVVPPLETGHYYLYQELTDYLRTAEEAAPHLLRLFSVGSSYEGRAIYLAEITNRAKGEGLEKPAIWIDGNLHGSELLASSACLELIRQLVSDYGRDPIITDLLDHCTFYIVPRVSPDGAEHCLANGELMHSGSRPYPAQPPSVNLRPGDVNGDGRALQMRILDEAGDWKPSRRDARLLVRRQSDDRGGPFYRLYPEGFLEGNVTAPIRPLLSRSLLDFDRNFPCGWKPENELEGAGPYPLSEPETRAIADFFRSRHNICIAVTCSSWGGGVSHPQASGEDLKLFQEMGRRLEEITGYKAAPCSHPAGSFLQWAYEHRGVVAFRPQLWSLGRAVGLEVEDPLAFATDRSEPESLSVVRWLDREAPGYGFVPWTPVEHPQLGAVEVGGWDPLYSWLNPPPGPIIQETSDKFVRMVIALASGLPRLRVRRVSEEVMGWSEFLPPDAGQGEFLPLRRLTVEVENSGFLAGWLTEQGRRMNCVAPMELRLHQDGATTLLMGEAFASTPALRGSAEADPSKSVWVRFEWIVRGTGHVQAEILHDKSGATLASWAFDNNSYGSPQQVQAPAPVQPQRAVAPPPPPPAYPAAPQRPAVPNRGPVAPQHRQPPPAIPQAPAGPWGDPPPPQRPAPGYAQQPPQAPPGPRPGPTRPPVPPQQARPEVPPGFGNLPPGVQMPARQGIKPAAPAASIGTPPPDTRPAAPAAVRPAAPELPQRRGVAQQGVPIGPPPPQQPPASPLGAPLGAPVDNVSGGSSRGETLVPPSTNVDGGAGRGRVLGSPPTKPGAVPAPAAPASSNFATRAQELVQAGQARREAQQDSGFSPGLPMKDPGERRDDAFSPGLTFKEFHPTQAKEPAFSPGLPLKAAYPQPGPADTAPAIDFDTPPPEAPPSESRIPTPLLLRRRPKENSSEF